MNNLFIIGAQRSGSTYLYNLLDDHPEVSMIRPARPEPKFFLSQDLILRGRDFYEKYFFSEPRPNTKYFGEKSTSYIESEVAAAGIANFYPNAKILMILRNPVDRAYSNYLFTKSHGLEKESFARALELEGERIKAESFSTSVCPYSYRTRGLYELYINNYLKYFNRHQIKILIFEEIVGNLEEIKNLYKWLDISPNHIPQTIKDVVNPSLLPREDVTSSLSCLALSFGDSISSLEQYIGRPIPAWRHRLNILSGLCI